MAKVLSVNTFANFDSHRLAKNDTQYIACLKNRAHYILMLILKKCQKFHFGEGIVLVCLHPALSRPTIRQLNCIGLALLAMTGRVTMLGISRWTGRRGSYRTVQRFFNTVIPWGQVFWAHRLVRGGGGHWGKPPRILPQMARILSVSGANG